MSPWFGSILSIRGRLYIQVKDLEGRWRQRATGLRAIRENLPKAQALLDEVRARLQGQQPLPDMRRTPALPTRRGSSYPGQVLKRRRAKDGAEDCEACGWRPPPPLGPSALNVHHVKPRAKGGTDEPANLVVLCPNCHATAHALTRKRRLAGRDDLLQELKSVNGMLTETVLERTSRDVPVG